MKNKHMSKTSFKRWMFYRNLPSQVDIIHLVKRFYLLRKVSKSVGLEDIIDNLKYTAIRPSNIHGNGLFAVNSITLGTELGELDGQVIPESLHNKLDLTLEWNAIKEGVLLVRPYRTKYSYINHSRMPNLKLVGYPLKVVALRNISEGEELTLDYRKEKLSKEYIDKKGKYYL